MDTILTQFSQSQHNYYNHSLSPTITVPYSPNTIITITVPVPQSQSQSQSNGYIQSPTQFPWKYGHNHNHSLSPNPSPTVSVPIPVPQFSMKIILNENIQSQWTQSQIKIMENIVYGHPIFQKN